MDSTKLTFFALDDGYTCLTTPMAGWRYNASLDGVGPTVCPESICGDVNADRVIDDVDLDFLSESENSSVALPEPTPKKTGHLALAYL